MGHTEGELLKALARLLRPSQAGPPSPPARDDFGVGWWTSVTSSRTACSRIGAFPVRGERLPEPRPTRATPAGPSVAGTAARTPALPRVSSPSFLVISA